MSFVRSWTLLADFWDDEAKRDWAVGFFGYPFDEMMQDWGKFTEFALDHVEEATTLEASVFR